MEPLIQILSQSQQTESSQSLIEQSERSVSFRLSNPSTLPPDKKQCIICLTDFQEGEEIESLPCIHLFHKNCIDEWLTNTNKCPLCKTTIYVDNPPIIKLNDNVENLRNAFERIENYLLNAYSSLERIEESINLIPQNYERSNEIRIKAEEEKKKEEIEKKIKKLNELQKEYLRLKKLKERFEKHE